MQGLLLLESQKRGNDRTLRPVYDYTKFIMKCADPGCPGSLIELACPGFTSG